MMQMLKVLTGLFVARSSPHRAALGSTGHHVLGVGVSLAFPEVTLRRIPKVASSMGQRPWAFSSQVWVGCLSPGLVLLPSDPCGASALWVEVEQM